MAVYTEVTFEVASALLKRLNLGELQSIEGCAGGIENTNYFVTTDQGAHVLTLFERLSAQQLPFYLRLMKHLALHGIPVPDPAICPPENLGAGSKPNSQGDLLYTVNGKPATVVNRLRGKSELSPTPAHCAAVGEMLAKMHLAGRDFELQQPNLRGLDWWNETVPVILPFLSADQASLLQAELAYQNHFAQSPLYAALPRGPIHADLFRDNVMFETDRSNAALHSAPTPTPAPASAPALTGFFDFYFAGTDTWLFDIAVCLNDWCIDLATGAPRHGHAQAFLDSYAQVRPLTLAEHHSLPALLRAAALRFWISRLWDLHLPRDATMLKAHDPSHLERVLRQRLLNLAPLPFEPETTDSALAPVA